ncbi:MAG: fibronectin type III domain-containing protein [Aquincola sp.]|nr:fibronectin type III domain-containing protein [Aquincola sp.]
MWRIRLQFLALVVIATSCGGGTGSTSGGGTDPGTTATLQWEAPADPNVRGFRVYYGTASRAYSQTKGAGIDAGQATRFVIANLQGGRTYYFAVTSYDASGNESDYSNEATKDMK